MEDFDVLNLEYLNKLKYQCFVWAEFFSVVDSIFPKPISSTLKHFFGTLLNKIRKVRLCIVVLHVKLELKQKSIVEVTAEIV